MSPLTRRLLAGPALAMTLVAGACSDGDDEALDATACDAYAAVGASFFGDPSTVPELLENLQNAVPADLEDDAAAYSSGLSASFDGDDAAMSDPAFVAASEALGQAVYDGCDTTEKLDVTGIDYAFEDLPSELDAGRLALRFTNGTEADEAHELVLMRKADGTTESLEELLELPEEEAMAKLAPVGVAFSDEAGGRATTLVDLEAGEYVAVCFIPTGGEDGPPHAFGGMAAEISVS